MAQSFKAVALNLDEVFGDAQITDDLRRVLHGTLAESEGRFDMEYRKEDFGSIVRLRRRKPAIRDKDGKVIMAANTVGALPVKSGRFVGGWNWKVKGTNATVSSQVPYAEHAHKVDQEAGSGLREVERFLLEDWERVAQEMADIIEDHLEATD